MPLFTIKRTTPRDASEAELEAMGFRAVYCAGGIAGLSWHRTYSDANGGVSLCIYEASDEPDIWAHSNAARIPCDEVRPVIEYLPDLPGDRQSAVPEYSIFLATYQLPRPAEDYLARSAALAAGTPEIGWVRSLWDAERRVLKTVLCAESFPLLERHMATAGLPHDELVEVEETLPSRFGGLASPEPVVHRGYGNFRGVARN